MGDPRNKQKYLDNALNWITVAGNNDESDKHLEAVIFSEMKCSLSSINNTFSLLLRHQ